MTDDSHQPSSTDRQQKRISHVARLTQQYERHRLGDTDDDAKSPHPHINKTISIANKAPPPPPPVARLHSRSPSRTQDNPFLDTYSSDIPSPPPNKPRRWTIGTRIISSSYSHITLLALSESQSIPYETHSDTIFVISRS